MNLREITQLLVGILVLVAGILLIIEPSPEIITGIEWGLVVLGAIITIRTAYMMYYYETETRYEFTYITDN